MEPKDLCKTCGERPALPTYTECSICLLGYDSAEAKKTKWKPVLKHNQDEQVHNDTDPLDVCPFCGSEMKPNNVYGMCGGCLEERRGYQEDW